MSTLRRRIGTSCSWLTITGMSVKLCTNRYALAIADLHSWAFRQPFEENCLLDDRRVAMVNGRSWPNLALRKGSENRARIVLRSTGRGGTNRRRSAEVSRSACGHPEMPHLRQSRPQSSRCATPAPTR